MQINPRVWDVFAWWEDDQEELDTWSLSGPATQAVPGDRFALWLSGREAGVYAVGRLASTAYPSSRPRGRYWLQPPTHGPYFGIDLSVDLYLFDRPIWKADLQIDPDFANALILRMPQSRNPIRVTDSEWAAIQRRLPRGSRRTQAAHRASRASGDVVVIERPLGSVVEKSTVAPSRVERTRNYRESRLVNDYQTWIGRPLVERQATLPSGERLVIDAFDPAIRCLIEAKASASRQDIRMAIGQLLDYRRHIDPSASIAILVPESPTSDLLSLLRSLGIQVIVKRGQGFAIL
jgi:hypothetical protein